ncbi:MAG TPA: UvrB/UvrC motif-containing protein, partial [Clostridia bacterium]|nr:UvrB/UvrC motif-containing protein [Clostridia bacterium]
MTDSIKKAVNETERRRTMQIAYNKEHGIIPTTIRKPIREKVVDITDVKHIPKTDIPNVIIELDAEMREAAERLDFERAIQVRELIKKLEKEIQGL